MVIETPKEGELSEETSNTDQILKKTNRYCGGLKINY
jgi:hypothetical protein